MLTHSGLLTIGSKPPCAANSCNDLVFVQTCRPALGYELGGYRQDITHRDHPMLAIAYGFASLHSQGTLAETDTPTPQVHCSE